MAAQILDHFPSGCSSLPDDLVLDGLGQSPAIGIESHGVNWSIAVVVEDGSSSSCTWMPFVLNQPTCGDYFFIAETPNY